MNPSVDEGSRVSNEDVLRLAELVKIDLAADEVDPLRADLEKVLRYVRQIDEADTEGVEALDTLGDGRFREDEPGPTLSREELATLEGFDALSGYFTAPAVFGDGGHA